MNSLKSSMMLVMGYLGAVIGAGFASGQEIMQFFVAYGSYGFKGAILATLLFALSGGVLLYTAHRVKISNYQTMITHLMGPRAGIIVDGVMALFLFLGISTMLSASGAVFYEHLYLPKSLGILLAYLVVGLVLFTGKKGLIMSYNFLVPLKLLLLLLISGYAAFFLNNSQPTSAAHIVLPARSEFWALSSLLYVAYNFALAMVVLTAYQPVTTCKDGIRGAVWGGLVLGIMVVLTYLALHKYLPAVLQFEVPMLYVAGQISITAKRVYTLVLWMGILTTATANAYGFAQRFARLTGISYSVSLFLCMTLALPVSGQSFSGLVGKIYPLFGILGVTILAALCWKTVKSLILRLAAALWAAIKWLYPRID